MDVLVIGGNGQLGRHLREELPAAEFWDRSIVDVSDIAALASKLAAVRPSVIINATAYTAVDKAESERDLSWRINAEAPAAMARAAQAAGVPFVHVSTDYVFDGTRVEGYVEDDATAPLNTYGRSKLGGEIATGLLCERHWILRTSWVFSEHGNNFPRTMLRLARQREELRVVDDQRGRPTYAGDLARCIASLIPVRGSPDPLPWGIHHVGAGPTVTWKQFAEVVLQRAAAAGLIPRVPRVVGIPTSEYPTPATRPRNSVLVTRELAAAHVRDPFNWYRGLDRMLGKLH